MSIEEHGVFVTHTSKQRHRRILAVIDSTVTYSKGGERTYTCKLSTFKDWVRRTYASEVDREHEDVRVVQGFSGNDQGADERSSGQVAVRAMQGADSDGQ